MVVCQLPCKSQSKNAPANRGKLYVLWGWNLGNYTKSDIHFRGADYDSTLKQVKSTDRQTAFSFDSYFNPLKIYQ